MPRTSHALMLAVLTVLSACETPYSTAVNGYDFDHQQSPAAVVLSDPQVYSRETLINDRLVEIDYLEQVLADSVDAIFEPQLRRDLQTLTGFVGQMNLLSDPVQGARIGREQDVLNLQHQRNLISEEEALVRARANLLEEQRRLEALQRGETPPDRSVPQGASSAGPPSQQSAGQSLPAAPGDQDVAAINRLTLGDIQGLLHAMDNVRELMDLATAGDRARTTDIRATPQEVFRDRQAYREEIRAALADVNLDDGHDIEGNALYRLQFRATVMPGEHRGQFAAARLTFIPPVLSDRDVAEVYFAWLAYVNREMNTQTYSRGSVNVGLQAVGAYTGMFHTVEYEANGVSSRLAVPEDAAAFFLWALCEPSLAASQVRATTTSDCPATRAAVPTSGFDLNTFSQAIGANQTGAAVCPTDPDLDQIDYAIGDILAYQGGPLLALSMIVSAVEGGLRTDQIDQTTFLRLVDTLTVAASTARQQTRNDTAAVLATVRQRFNATNCAEGLRERLNRLESELARPYSNIHSANPDYLLGDRLIDAFRELLTQGQPTVAGEVATFFARPVDQAQRISSIQGAANAVDLALAMRTQMDGGGLSGAFGANFVRQAVGRIETLERAPIVVGFNDREPDYICPRSTRAGRSAPDCAAEGQSGDLQTYSQAGWIFGPTLQPADGGQRLAPMQNLANHSVSIDMSAPGWWPWLTARLETAWIANWGPASQGNPFQQNQPIASRTFRITLPHNAADMQALTQHITGLGSPLTSPRIDEITPDVVTVCPGSRVLRLQVAGRNLWQGTEAYLDGVRAETVRVLPDMGGVDLQFPTANLPMRASESSARLVVWTRDQRASHNVVVRRLPADAPFCATSGTSLSGLSVNRGWIASGSNFILTAPTANELAQRRELRVEMRRYDPETNAALSAWMPLASDAGAAPTATVAERAIAVQMPSSAVAGYPDGELVQISVVIQSADRTETRSLVDRAVAYYAAPNQVAAESAGQATISAAESNIQLIVTLPKAPHLRFEGFPESGAPNATQMTARGELPLGGVTYVYETTGAWDAINPIGGRPRFQGQARLTSGNAAALTPALTSNGQNLAFVITVMGQPFATAPINVKPRT